jgi:hypothetical protein
VQVEWKGDYYYAHNCAIATESNRYLDGLACLPEHASTSRSTSGPLGQEFIYLWMSDYHPDGGQVEFSHGERRTRTSSRVAEPLIADVLARETDSVHRGHRSEHHRSARQRNGAPCSVSVHRFFRRGRHYSSPHAGVPRPTRHGNLPRPGDLAQWCASTGDPSFAALCALVRAGIYVSKKHTPARFLTRQGRVHARVSASWASEFGAMLRVPLTA